MSNRRSLIGEAATMMKGGNNDYYLKSTKDWRNPTENGDVGKRLYQTLLDLGIEFGESYELNPPQEINVYVNNIKINYIYVGFYDGKILEISLMHNESDYEWYHLRENGNLEYNYD